MNDPKVGNVGRSVRVGQEEYLKPEQDTMLAEAGEEDGFTKCFDDVTGKELPWQAVKEAREKELMYLLENLACMKRSMSTQLCQSTASRQSTQSGSTLTKNLRSRRKSVHELLPESSNVGQARLVCGNSPRWKL